MSSVDAFHLGLRAAHIAAGAVGLVLFWIPVFAKKGGRLHIWAGRGFACCAAFVATSALASSGWALLDPVTFFGGSLERTSEAGRPYLLEQGRFLFAVLGYLSVVVLTGLWYGLRVVWTRDRHEALREPALLGLQAASALAAVALLLFAGWNLFLAHRGEHVLSAAPANKYWVPVVLGAFGLFAVHDDLGYILRPRASRMAWWYKHMENMLGVGIAFHTAFLVFGASRLLAYQLPGPLQLLPWLLPSMIGIPAMMAWVRVYKRRFGELPAAGEANAEA